ncbi:MAG TPA: hypothetical protein VG435_05890 [Acidimicrobiales bacterium]|nr:hypothetical protein [Acidimicrobiales bacterium]
MLVTNHVLAGALIGRALARHPVLAFGAGVVSHIAMDACPHWGDDAVTMDTPEFFRIACCDGCCGLAAMAIAAGLSPRRTRLAVVAGMAGGAVVDTDKPFDFFLGWNPFPERWNRFHKRIQNEAPHRMKNEFAVGTLLALVCWRVLRQP